uniref:protein O-GlcNAc transferase n=1 Tax=Globisporangium ultimum (strain ATCC 200006 / CBS 805.95 / DAOM BR144) TaxID=431595 RepID=K3WDH2_GLOUD
MVALEKTVKQVIEENQAAVQDTRFPTPYQYMGVAQYALGDLDQATRTFEEAVRVNDDDVDSWLQLGKCYLYKLKMPQAAAALEVAVLRKGATDELHSLFKARNWMANWQDRELMVDQIERFVDENLRASKQTSVNALDFADLPLPSVLALSQQAHHMHAPSADRQLCCEFDDDWQLETPALRIGFVLSNFGVHPVSTLMRDMLVLLSGPDHPNVTVYCYSLTAASSWWLRNISRHVNHTHGKRDTDLVLDTTLKNGHTTLLDALFAGVPVLTLEGNRMSNRADTSALRTLDLQRALTVNSLKEYVDVAVFLATHPQVMSMLRAQVEECRLVYPLLDTSKYTRNFVDALQSAWAVTKAANNGFSHAQQRRTFHVFPARQLTQLDPHPLHVQSALNDPHTGDEYAAKVQAALATSAPVLLHIGGSVAKPGWWVVDVNDGTHVDFQLRMANLYAFPDDSVTAIYASHVLEHNHFQLHDEVTRTLHEWWCVLKPDGALFVSVPDLHVLASLFVRADMTPQDQYLVMKMVLSGQIDAYDVHNVGFFEPLLVAFLENAGFCEIERVANFGLFNDTSAMAFHGTPISLNVQARTCDKKDGAQHVH